MRNRAAPVKAFRRKLFGSFLSIHKTCHCSGAGPPGRPATRACVLTPGWNSDVPADHAFRSPQRHAESKFRRVGDRGSAAFSRGPDRPWERQRTEKWLDRPRSHDKAALLLMLGVGA